MEDATRLFAQKKFNLKQPKEYIPNPQKILQTKPKWKDKEYRQDYMEAALEQTISWQIGLNRKARGISQGDLANMTGLSVEEIQENEDTTFEEHDLKTLVKIANAFDCAVMVKFISYSKLAYESYKLSEKDLYACSYGEETSKDKEVTHVTTSRALC